MGGFNYPLPTRSTLARGGDPSNGGHYENGYPIDDYMTEQQLGNPLQFAGKKGGITPEWGNGQLLGIPTAPSDPPTPADYVDDDYLAGSETKDKRDYTKPPVILNPLPASQPKPSIDSLSYKSCEEITVANNKTDEEATGEIDGEASFLDAGSQAGTTATIFLAVQAQRHLRSNKLMSQQTLNKALPAEIADRRTSAAMSKDMVMDDVEAQIKKDLAKLSLPKLSKQKPMWLTIKGGNLGKKDISDVAGVDIKLVDRHGNPTVTLPCTQVKTGPPATMPEEEEEEDAGLSGPAGSGSGPSEEDTASGASGASSGASGPEATSFGGNGGLADRLNNYIGLKMGSSSFLQVNGLEPEGGEEGGDESTVVNGIDTKSSNIVELSCVVGPYNGEAMFGYVIVNTISMGPSEAPPLNSIIAGKRAGLDEKDQAKESPVNFCCPKCPVSDLDLAATVDAAVAGKDRIETWHLHAWR